MFYCFTEGDMPLFSKINVSDNDNTVVTIGDNNFVNLSQVLSKTNSASITNSGENWGKVVETITDLQKVIRDLPDEHEKLRDQKLIPSLSKAKHTATVLAKKPSEDKKKFLEEFKIFIDIAAKVADIAKVIAPFVTIITKAIGIPFP